ncbi:MAG: hypothetical protein ABJA82_06180 [Myxococcales bacterium]
MGSLDDSFAQLLGRQPSDKEKQNLYRARDALNLKTTDAVWLLLMVLQHYEALYEKIPERIAKTAYEVTQAVRVAAEAEARVMYAQTKRALAEAVRESAVKVAKAAAEGAVAKWVSIAVGVIVVAMLLVGWNGATRGRQEGRAVGENMATRACGALVAASSWANTPDGQLAYAMAKAGSIGDVARCSGRGMTASDGWCNVQSERGKVFARWALPTGGLGAAGAKP